VSRCERMYGVGGVPNELQTDMNAAWQDVNDQRNGMQDRVYGAYPELDRHGQPSVRTSPAPLVSALLSATNTPSSPSCNNPAPRQGCLGEA